MPMLLRNKDRQTLTSIFSSVMIPMEVWAYGSRVNGTAHSGSDLDLVVRSPDLKKLPVGVINDIKEKIKYSNIPIIVEVFDWSKLPESFHDNILKQHEIFYINSALMVNEPPLNYPKTPHD